MMNDVPFKIPLLLRTQLALCMWPTAETEALLSWALGGDRNKVAGGVVSPLCDVTEGEVRIWDY